MALTNQPSSSTGDTKTGPLDSPNSRFSIDAKRISEDPVLRGKALIRAYKRDRRLPTKQEKADIRAWDRDYKRSMLASQYNIDSNSWQDKMYHDVSFGQHGPGTSNDDRRYRAVVRRVLAAIDLDEFDGLETDSDSESVPGSVNSPIHSSEPSPIQHRLMVKMPSGDISPDRISVSNYDDAGSLFDRVVAHFHLPSCVLKLGGKVLERGRLIHEYLEEGADTLHVLLSIVGGMPKGIMNQRNGKIIGKGTKTKKKKNQSSPQKASTRGPRQYISGGRAEMNYSACAAKFMLALANPFNKAVEGVCNPCSTDGSETIKRTVRRELTITTNASGDGYIFLNPSLGNDTVFGYYTGAAYNGGSSQIQMFSANNTLTPGIQRLFMTKAPYSQSDLVGTATTDNVAVKGRIVSVGVRITYAGTEMGRSGVYTLLHEPTHSNLMVNVGSTFGAANPSGIQDRDNAVIKRVTEEPVLLSVFPVEASECEFGSLVDGSSYNIVYPFSDNTLFANNQATYTDSINGVLCGSPVACILIEGCVSQNFQVEIVCHYEYGGAGISGTTPNEPDIDGGQFAVRAGIRAQGEAGGRGKPYNWSLFRDAMVELSRRAARIAVPMAEGALMAALA